MCRPPSSRRAKSGLAANTQRRPASCATKRNGPLPMGCSFQAARRSSVRGIESSRRAGRMARSVSTSGIASWEWANRITTVESFGSFTNATSAKSFRRGYAVAASLAADRVHATSRAVVGTGVVTLTFVLVRLAPGDPVERLLGPTATPAQLAAQRRALGLDRPLAAQYAIWLARFVRGDWGRSIATGRPVRELLGDAVPATVALVGTSLILSYLLGLAVGAWQSGAGPRVDAALSVTTVTLFALPGFWLGLMLAMAFTYWAHWLPAFGATGLDANALTGWSRLADRLRHFALPLATLTLTGIGGAARSAVAGRRG